MTTPASDPVTTEPSNPLANALDAIQAPTDIDTSVSYVDSMTARLEAALSPEPPKDDPKPADDPPPADTPATDDPPPVEPDPDPKDKSASANLVRLRKSKEEAERKMKEYEARVAELEEKVKTPVIDPELKKKAELADEYEQRLALVDVESTQQYQTAVAEPASRILNALDDIVKSYDGDVTADAIVAAYNIADPKARKERLTALTENFDVEDRAAIRAKGPEWQALVAKRDEIKANAKQALAEARALEAQSKQVMTAKEREQYTKAASKALGVLKERLPAIADDEALDSVYSKIEAEITAPTFNFDTPDVKAFAAASGVLVPHLARALRERDAKIAELEKTVGSYTKASPSARSGGRAVSPATQADAEVDASRPWAESAADRFAQFLAGNGQM